MKSIRQKTISDTAISLVDQIMEGIHLFWQRYENPQQNIKRTRIKLA
jgi:hypothetical protein